MDSYFFYFLFFSLAFVRPSSFPFTLLSRLRAYLCFYLPELHVWTSYVIFLVFFNPSFPITLSVTPSFPPQTPSPPSTPSSHSQQLLYSLSKTPHRLPFPSLPLVLTHGLSHPVHFLIFILSFCPSPCFLLCSVLVYLCYDMISLHAWPIPSVLLSDFFITLLPHVILRS